MFSLFDEYFYRTYRLSDAVFYLVYDTRFLCDFNDSLVMQTDAVFSAVDLYNEISRGYFIDVIFVLIITEYLGVI